METFYGPIVTVRDALLVIEACRLGLLAHVQRRLSTDEKHKLIRVGSVFVLSETESCIQRWTDGRSWSASRICGDFLVYKEVDSRRRYTYGFANSLSHGHPRSGYGYGHRSPSAQTINGHRVTNHHLEPSSDANHDSALSEFSVMPTTTRGSHSRSMPVKQNGLLKRCFTVTNTAGMRIHLIAYHDMQNMDDPKFQALRPSINPMFSNIVIDLAHYQNVSMFNDIYRRDAIKGVTASPSPSSSTLASTTTPHHAGFPASSQSGTPGPNAWSGSSSNSYAFDSATASMANPYASCTTAYANASCHSGACSSQWSVRWQRPQQQQNQQQNQQPNQQQPASGNMQVHPSQACQPDDRHKHEHLAVQSIVPPFPEPLATAPAADICPPSPVLGQTPALPPAAQHRHDHGHSPSFPTYLCHPHVPYAYPHPPPLPYPHAHDLQQQQQQQQQQQYASPVYYQHDQYQYQNQYNHVAHMPTQQQQQQQQQQPQPPQLRADPQAHDCVSGTTTPTCAQSVSPPSQRQKQQEQQQQPEPAAAAAPPPPASAKIEPQFRAHARWQPAVASVVFPFSMK
ncbi:Gti1/Pac2 family-domain-containing protein [Entophlyctis helioformis]|nr:Gti1/Pac2 family-domain-containing protein [Entophlyctis helioformis]